MTTQGEEIWLDDECEHLQEKIHIITMYQKPYIANSKKDGTGKPSQITI
jgi:hypothetical protein